MKETNLDNNQISEKLITFIWDELKNPNIEYLSPITQLQGGYETNIYRFQLEDVDDEYSQCLVLRLYPQFYGIRNAIWESKVQNVLVGAGYPAAKVHFVCTDLSILGGAFFIMDYIAGGPLLFAPRETVPGILGNTHADLHKIDPDLLTNTLKEQGVDEYGYSLNARFEWLINRADKLSWIHEGIDWLIKNRPPVTDYLSVCHGDFHPLNILVKDGVVTGVLDWAGFMIGDPAYDIANTIVLTTIPVKHLVGSMEVFSSVDWDLAAELYLSAYQSYKELDRANLNYYRVRRCLQALIEGAEGQKVWQHPRIVNDLVRYIKDITEIRIAVPENKRTLI